MAYTPFDFLLLPAMQAAAWRNMDVLPQSFLLGSTTCTRHSLDLDSSFFSQGLHKG